MYNYNSRINLTGWGEVFKSYHSWSGQKVLKMHVITHGLGGKF